MTTAMLDRTTPRPALPDEAHRADAVGTNRRFAAMASGVLTIQLVVGYEWLVSGLTKLYRGGFAAGLAEEVRAKSVGSSGWYRAFLDRAVIPNGWAVGWLVLIGELVVGVALLGAASVFLVRREQVGARTRQALLATTALASIAGIVMAISFHLANGAAHPWLIPKDGFDEGVDLDSVLPLVQLAIAIVATKLFLLGRRHPTAVTAEVAERDA